MTPQNWRHVLEVPKVHMVILWYSFSKDVLINTCGCFFFLFVCPQGLLFLQLRGHRRQAAPTQTQRQQDPHRGLGEDPPHDQYHWSPHGEELMDGNTHVQAYKCILGTNKVPEGEQPSTVALVFIIYFI